MDAIYGAYGASLVGVFFVFVAGAFFGMGRRWRGTIAFVIGGIAVAGAGVVLIEEVDGFYSMYSSNHDYYRHRVDELETDKRGLLTDLEGQNKERLALLRENGELRSQLQKEGTRRDAITKVLQQVHKLVIEADVDAPSKPVSTPVYTPLGKVLDAPATDAQRAARRYILNRAAAGEW